MTDIFSRIQENIHANPVVLFMKGTQDHPQCGFSATVVQILRTLQVSFLNIDVLADPDMRQGIKDFSNWPTVPQLYIAGEFIGGSDIVRTLYQTGELQETLEKAGIPSSHKLSA